MGRADRGEEAGLGVKTYLNHSDRVAVVKLVGCLTVIEEAEERKHFPEMFGKQRWADLKRAKAFLHRALDGLAERLGFEQSLKVVNMARSHKLVLEGKAAPVTAGEVAVKVDQLFDLAEMAISNHCTGCTKDHRNCRLYKVLDSADIPPAETVTTTGCPYRQ